jgi:TM2 domain-containing membrane protein YozV
MGGGAPPGFQQPQQPGQYPGAQQPYPGAGPMMPQPGFGGMAGMPGMMAGGPPKQFMITLLLCIFGGYFGAHRFYSGHFLFGAIQFLTGGGCGVWWAIDLFLIVTGKYTDAQGRPLAK